MDAKRKPTTEAAALNWRNKARRRFSVEERQAMVQECLVPGVSVSEVALRHGVNANQLFKWRRKHLEVTARAALVPVTIESGDAGKKVPAVIDGDGPWTEQRHGVIEIELCGARIRLNGVVDPKAVRAVVLALRQA
jgi:transposase